jgi:two-component system C4-dicarboxylate transport sensor histidine kinase DctB
MLASSPLTQEVLASPEKDESRDLLNRLLEMSNDIFGASEAYVMDGSGTTLSASNWQERDSFIGQNFAYRPYFQNAMQGRLGRFFALGTTSGKRGYYFGYPAVTAEGITGVAVVKVDVDTIEQSWGAEDHEVLVTDRQGVIFMSSRPEWNYRATRPISVGEEEVLARERKYADRRLEAFPGRFETSSFASSRLLHLQGETATSPEESYLLIAREMADAGWQLNIVVPLKPLAGQAAGAAAIALVLFAALFIILVGLVERQRNLQAQRTLEARNRRNLEKAAAELEHRVEDRTADLNLANQRLIEEIGERAAAEQQLRKTQADLLQAGKLAALGQMSAALSHELNQPLGAVKSYADNAGAYLDRNRPGEARENIDRISALVDRMAAISRHLRNFARKPEERLMPVSLATVVGNAMEILAGRIKAAGAEIILNLPKEDLWVLGGEVRLEQVIVNLVNNALDAMDGQTTARVEIGATADPGWVTIAVRDHGRGVSDEIASQVFDPFFTTKGVAKGLGLGLSISYNIIKDFGGTLALHNHADGGAVFTIELRRAAAAARTAAQ